MLERIFKCLEWISPVHWILWLMHIDPYQDWGVDMAVIVTPKPPPPYATVADCGYCFEDVGNG